MQKLLGCLAKIISNALKGQPNLPTADLKEGPFSNHTQTPCNPGIYTGLELLEQDVFLNLQNYRLFFISPTPELALLHLTLGTTPKQFHPLIIQILTAAHMTIALHWKTNIAPIVSEVTNSVKSSAQYERLLASNSDSIPKFDNNWKFCICLFPIRDT